MKFNFVDYFMKLTANAESPTSYLEWAAYISIAATLRHNVYISVPDIKVKITPNIYVLIVGDSGATRKSLLLLYVSNSYYVLFTRLRFR